MRLLELPDGPRFGVNETASFSLVIATQSEIISFGIDKSKSVVISSYIFIGILNAFRWAVMLRRPEESAIDYRAGGPSPL